MDEEDLMGDGDEEDWTQTWEDNEDTVEGNHGGGLRDTAWLMVITVYSFEDQRLIRPVLNLPTLKFSYEILYI